MVDNEQQEISCVCDLNSSKYYDQLTSQQQSSLIYNLGSSKIGQNHNYQLQKTLVPTAKHQKILTRLKIDNFRH